MATVGFQFLNSEKLIDSIIPFSSLPDLMLARRINSGRNQSNNPTYITKNSSKEIDLYGKTYGASKYETSLLCYAISNIANRTKQNINLYQVAEGNLQILPQSSLSVIEKMNNIKLIQADMILERKAFAENDSLRSPKYIYNLLDRLGPKKCAFCDCRIPEIIQGAHILPVSRIKQNNLLSFEQKLQHATDGHNGLWLCENHHKLFDENIININLNGKLVIDSHIASDDKMFIEKITTNYSLASEILTDEFIEYLNQRNSVINF